MRLHANLDCPHIDSPVMRVRQLHDADDPHGVLKEIHRLRHERVELSDRQKLTVAVHEAGALSALNAITIEDFDQQIEGFVGVVLEMEDYNSVADLNMWRVQKAILAGRAELARVLIARFFERLPHTPVLEAFQDTARAFLAIDEGDEDAAMQFCRVGLEKFKRRENPCLYEIIALRLAQLFARRGMPLAAREVLRRAYVPEDYIDRQLAAFK